MGKSTFEEKMEHLKKSYEEMPLQSSRDEIIKELEKQNKKRKNLFRPTIYAASILMVFLVGGILLMSGNFGMKEDPANQAAPEEAAPFTEHENTGEGAKDTPAPKPVDRPETKTGTIMLEGSEQEKKMKLHVNQKLGFSSYIVSDLKAEKLNEGPRHLTNLFSNYDNKLNEDNALNILWREDITTIKGMKEHLMPNESGQWTNDETRASLSFQLPVDDVLFARSSDQKDIVQNYIFKLDGKVYGVTLRYLPLYEAGFVPRVQKFIEELRWSS